MNTEIKIICGDCLEVLPTIETESIDFILTDPPFNVGLKYKSTDDELSDARYEKWCCEWIKELYRVLKKRHYCIIFTGDKKCFSVFNAIMNSGFEYHHFLKWYKPQCQKALSGTVLFGRTELAFVLSKESPNVGLINKKALWQDTLIYSNTLPTDSDAVEHEARRPIELYQQIIGGFTKEGDSVLDCFLGTGTTAIACTELNRSCVGIEIEPEYCEISKERVDKAYEIKKVSEALW